MNFYTDEACTKGVIIKSDYEEITNFVFVLDISASMRSLSSKDTQKLLQFYNTVNIAVTIDNLPPDGWLSLKDENNREYVNRYTPLHIAYKTYIYAKKRINTFYSSKINKHNLITFESIVKEYHDNVPKYEDICGGGGTNFEDMTKILSSYVSDNGRSFIILLTDGQSSVLPQTLKYLQNILQLTNSVLSVVGFTDSINERLLNQYVSNDGEYDKILEGDEIESVMDNMLNKFTDQIDRLIITIDKLTFPIKMVNGVSEVIELRTQPTIVKCNENITNQDNIPIAINEVVVNQQDYVTKWNEYIDTCVQFTDNLQMEIEYYRSKPDTNEVLNVVSSKKVFDKIINNDLNESNKNTELTDTLLNLKMYRKYFEQEEFVQKCDQGKINVKDKIKFFTNAMNS